MNGRYDITVTRLHSTGYPAKDHPAITVYIGDDWAHAQREYNDAVKRSNGKWGNYAFIGQTITLYDGNMAVREHVGTIQCKRDEAASAGACVGVCLASCSGESLCTQGVCKRSKNHVAR